MDGQQRLKDFHRAGSWVGNRESSGLAVVKILITTVSHYYDRPSGSARIALDEAHELRDRGEDVWIIGNGSDELPEYEIQNGIHLIRYCPPKMPSWHPRRAFVHQRAAGEALRRHLPRIDAIHGHIPLATISALNLYGDSVRAYYTIHSPAKMEMSIEWKNSDITRRLTTPLGLLLINRIEAECLRRSNVITALSQYTKDCVRRIHGDATAGKVKVISGWVDTSRFKPLEDRRVIKSQLGWPTDLPLLFTLRRLVARMGLDRLLDACRYLLSEGHRFHLVIGGDGSLRSKLELQSKSLGLSDAVTFMGRVSDESLPLAYAACDAFVLPSSELECFGLIAIEALAAGRPVLATSAGAIPEVIREFEPKWLARSSATSDIANLLRDFLSGRLPTHNPTQLHDHVRRRYSQQQVLHDFIEATVGSGKDRAFVSED